jgi:prepilin-type N-terminal cleavage/methylation domain-containing protein
MKTMRTYCSINMSIRRPSARSSGFTLLEVMIALGILAVALVGLIGRTARNVRLTHEMGMLDVAVDLTRGKMYDIEAELLKEGFSETTQEFDGDFSKEGWPDIKWEAVVEKVELPNLAAMNALQGEGEEGEDAGGGGSALGDIVGGLMPGGGLGGGGIDASMGASIISSQFEMFQQVLEVSIRKVTLKVTYDIGNEEEDIVVACYFTDPYGMSRAIGGLGALTGSSQDNGVAGGQPPPARRPGDTTK